MITRKKFLEASAALVAAPLGLQACAPADAPDSYEVTVKNIWRPTSIPLSGELALQRELVRYATLAPSGHNTQCWKFHIEQNSISILPDFTRRTPVVDPDDHHLFVSLGCALENLAQASLANGLKSLAEFDAASSNVAVKLESTQPLASPLYRAIPERQCTRGLYDGAPLSVSELKTLELAGTGNGVSVLLFTARPGIENILQLVIDGNTTQLNDEAFVKELKQWIRFSGSEAVATGDGLYSAASGSPSVPRWLGSPMFDIMFKAKSENDKYAGQTRSSAGIAVFVSDVEDKTHWIEAGRCYERFALQATALGIRNAMLNQTVEVPVQRQKLAGFLGLKGGRPDLVVRFGRGATMPSSLRRRVEAVLV
jgi:hypothetical protein